MNTWEYTSQAANKLGLKSDRAVARWLKIHHSYMSKLRNGSGLETHNLIKIAEALDIDPLRMMADIEAERSDDPKVRKFWKSVGQRASTTLILILSLGITGLSLFPSTTYAKSNNAENMYYAQSQFNHHSQC